MGRGVKVTVLDMGIDGDHPDLCVTRGVDGVGTGGDATGCLLTEMLQVRRGSGRTNNRAISLKASAWDGDWRL